jgi:hypothetical protein
VALQLLANEYFTCKLLTAMILQENPLYLDELADFVQAKMPVAAFAENNVTPDSNPGADPGFISARIDLSPRRRYLG